MKTPTQLIIQSVVAQSSEYNQALEIRYKHLRQPLGLIFTPQELEQDKIAHHVIARNVDEVIGCVLGIPQNRVIKIRQMLVIPEYRHQGIGSLLLEKIEKVFYDLGKNYFYLHARLESLQFYLKHGYIPTGKIFMEVGIPHQRLEKFY